MIRWYAVVNSEKTSQLFPKSGFKLTSPVCGDHRWGTKPGNPSTHKGFGHSLGRDVHEGNGLWSAGEPMNAGGHVAESLREWKRTNEIDVDVVESDTRCGKLRERYDSLSMNLGLLALETCSSP